MKAILPSYVILLLCHVSSALGHDGAFVHTRQFSVARPISSAASASASASLLHREKSRVNRRRHNGGIPRLLMSASDAEEGSPSSSEATQTQIPLGMVESILIEEVNNSSSSPLLPAFLRASDDNRALSALRRAVEIGTVLGGKVMAPILTSLAVEQNYWPTAENGGWEAFWSTSTQTSITMEGGGGSKNHNQWSNATSAAVASSSSQSSVSHAQRLAMALEQLGPTYVKFGQALGSRPDVAPPSLAAALSSLQDDMTPFDSNVAKGIISSELKTKGDVNAKEVESLVASLTEEPVAAASIGQVYKAHLAGRGDVAVKVQRPGVRLLVERDAELLLTVAKFLESIPALPSSSSVAAAATSAEAQSTTNDKQQQSSSGRLINTELVSATQEFMSRIFEELDYRNEASNCITFASLYSERHGTSRDVSVIVPEVYLDYCTENVLVMEWIEGTKLTDVQSTPDTGSDIDNDDTTGAQKITTDEAAIKENLELVKVAIDSTLSQLLVTGILHADPHAGNLLKLRRDDGSVTLGYLDFGLLSTIPSQVRDALICSVALQVFERNVDAVSSLFGELQLIPQRILDDDSERAALAEALHITFENSLLYPDTSSASTNGKDGAMAATAIPDLKFDKLLDSLSRLVPRFQFDLPPYFINNARALSTLEGIAKSLDPSFNVLTIMYPYALTRLLQNPSGSPVVERTLQSLIRSGGTEYGRIDRSKIRRLLRDSALISGRRKRRVVWDVMKTRPGRKLARGIVGEELRMFLSGKGKRRRRKGEEDGDGGQRKKKKKKKWYYLEL